MNILFLSTENPYPPDHGHHIRTYNVLRYLSRKNNIFFVGFAKREDVEARKELERLCTTVDIFIIPEGKWKWRLYLSIILNLFSPFPFTVRKFYRNNARIRINEIIKEKKIDFVHVDMLYLGLYYKTINHLPNAIVNHNIESLLYKRGIKSATSFFIKLYLTVHYLKLYNFERKMCSRFDICTVVSDYDMEILRRMSPDANIAVVPNGVDIEFFKPSSYGSPQTSLCWVGGMKSVINASAVDYFLDEILPLVYSEIPDAKTNIIGKSPTPKLLERAKIDRNIRVTGYVSDVRPYIEESLVFVAPLRNGSGTKLKVLNAMAMGKAVVTTSIGAEGIKAKPNEDIMIEDNPKDFAEKIVYLLKNPKAEQIMGQRARALIEEYYDWEVIGKGMDNIYNQLMLQRKS